MSNRMSNGSVRARRRQQAEAQTAMAPVVWVWDGQPSFRLTDRQQAAISAMRRRLYEGAMRALVGKAS